MPVETCLTMQGNTVEEAVNKALRALSITREQAEIEILAEPKQGFLGVGNQQAKIKVSLKQEAVAEFELTDLLIELDMGPQPVTKPKVDKRVGTVAVREGRLIVTNPTEDGKYATVKPGNNIKVLVNGREIADETPVKTEDEIKIELIDNEPVSSVELLISEDKTEAAVRLIRQPGVRYKLMPQEPANLLNLITEVEVLELPPVSPTDVRRYLQENNVVEGIIEEALAAVVEQPNSPEPLPVARGVKPVPCCDAYIRYPFQESAEENPEQGMFGRNQLPVVTPGEVIAVKVPGQPGTDGRAVTGEVLPAGQPVQCEINIKNGCELSNDGEKAISLIGGRPCLEAAGGRTIVSVEPIYEVKEVNQTSGDIRFTGDVEVRGSVGESLKVEADGNIVVYGDITRATLKAGSSVIVHKMVLGSTIVAGGKSAVYTSMLPHLTEIRANLHKVYLVADQLKSAPGFKTSDIQAKGDGPLIQLLMDSKFRDLPKAIGEVMNTVSGHEQDIHNEVLKVAQLLNRSLCTLGPLHLDSTESLRTLSKAVEQSMDIINSCICKDDCIKLKYVQNSTLMSSGDVIIDGQGGYISTISAGGNVVVSGNPGIARGVRILANGSVTVKELGSEFDTQTSVTIKGNGKLSVGLIHPNVIVQIGSERFRVDRAYKNFDAYLNSENRLTVEKLSADTV